MSDLPRNEDELKVHIDGILRRIRHGRELWDEGLGELRTILQSELKSVALHLIEAAARRERLEFQWKLQELVEEVAPPPPPKPEPAPEEPAAEEPQAEAAPDGEETPEGEEPPPGALRTEDLIPIYEDPRGILIHQHRIDGRWVLTQVNPMTGQPQSMELSDAQRSQVKAELATSPYWVGGAVPV